MFIFHTYFEPFLDFLHIKIDYYVRGAAEQSKLVYMFSCNCASLRLDNCCTARDV